IYLYDDKAVIALNYKDGTKTVNFNDMECALSQRASIPGSDLEILSPPNKNTIREDGVFVWYEDKNEKGAGVNDLPGAGQSRAPARRRASPPLATGKSSFVVLTKELFNEVAALKPNRKHIGIALRRCFAFPTEKHKQAARKTFLPSVLVSRRGM
ncbi:MAG: hypothetical protein IJ649_11120, partial [Oscillospiraceae bacterium]|nr:hypothetical protein [Oscillospiraceae bacterium]